MSRLLAIILLVIGLGMVSIAVFTLFIPEPVESPEPLKPLVPSQPAEPRQPEETPQPVKSPEPLKPPEENVLIFSEKELQDKVDELVDRANKAGVAQVEYVQVKVEQDRMLVSAKGKAMGYQAETEDMDVRFEDKTVFVSGKVSAFGFSPTLTAEVDIHTDSGKLSVEVKTFRLGKLPLIMFDLSKDKISKLVNDAIESRGLKLPFDIESVRIEDGKLIIKYK